MSNVKVIQLGLGKVVSNYGTHNGVPAVFIEPVLGEPGELGADLKGDREPVSAPTCPLPLHNPLQQKDGTFKCSGCDKTWSEYPTVTVVWPKARTK